MDGQEILYHEDFSNSGGFTRPATAVGWKGFAGDGHRNDYYHIAELADPDGVQYNSPLSNPEGIGNNGVDGEEYGAVFWSPTTIFNVAIATQEFSGETRVDDIGAIGWDFHTDAPSSYDGQLMMRALIQVGGRKEDTDNWYASTPMLVTDTAIFDEGGPLNGFYQGAWKRTTVAVPGHWIPIPSFDYSGSRFSWPESGFPKFEEAFDAYPDYQYKKAPLPAGTVHGFGLLIDRRYGGNLWIDNFTLYRSTETMETPVVSAEMAGDSLSLHFASNADQSYQLLKSTDDMATFHTVGRINPGSGEIMTMSDNEYPQSDKVFYALRVNRALAHPGALHSPEQLEATRQSLMAADAGTADAFAALESEAMNALTHTPQPPAVFDVPGAYEDHAGHKEALKVLSEDAWAAYSLAIAAQLTDAPDSEAYAAKALQVLDAWASVNEATAGHDGDLCMAYAGVGLVYAAELLRDDSDWPEEQRERFEKWVRSVFLRSCETIIVRNNNWADWGLLGCVASHYFLEERGALEAYGLRLREMIDEKIEPDGEMPAETKRGRGGIWYTYFALAPMTAASQVLYNAGIVDLFHYTPSGGGGLRTALDYLFTYCLDPEAWPHYDGDDLINPPEPHRFYGTLFEAMAGVYEDGAYAAWVADSRPVMNYGHHYAWAVPTLLRPIRILSNHITAHSSNQ